ncbi:hypothetical protein SK128_001417, partial [Halocaridina rubra]
MAEENLWNGVPSDSMEMKLFQYIRPIYVNSGVGNVTRESFPISKGAPDRISEL